MTILARDLMTEASQILLDVDGIRWPDAELLEALNSGLREIATNQPEASSQTRTIALVAGALQTLPTDAVGLMDITRNMGATGTVPGRMIRQVERTELDAVSPGWHRGAQKDEIRHFMVDPRTPREFYVYPTALPTKVEAVLAVMPTPCADAAAALPIDDTYANALLNYMLHKAYAKDLDFATSEPKSKSYYQLFAAQVGIKTSADKATEPRARSTT